MVSTVNKEDVKAIKKAESIFFYAKKEEAALRLKRNNTETTIYCKNLSHLKNGYTSGYACILSAKFKETWQTIASLIKPGDVLGICFDQDAFTNGYCERAGLHADICKLIIEKKSKIMTFLLDTSVCPDNTARMVR